MQKKCAAGDWALCSGRSKIVVLIEGIGQMVFLYSFANVALECRMLSNLSQRLLRVSQPAPGSRFCGAVPVLSNSRFSLSSNPSVELLFSRSCVVGAGE
jgi:hypothetical protein